MKFTTASVKCFHCQSLPVTNLQGTLPTQPLPCKVPTAAFKHQQVRETENKSGILQTDKTCSARALGCVNPTGATGAAAACSTCIPCPIPVDAGGKP